MDGEEDEGGV